MEDTNNNQSSFICYNCSQVNYYNIYDYVDNNTKGQLLLGMLIYKTKEVSIMCKNPTCRHKNMVTIKYL